MSARKFMTYLKAIDVLEARESLANISIAQYPTLKPDSQRKKHSALVKQAYPRHLSGEKAVSTKEAFMMLTGKVKK